MLKNKLLAYTAFLITLLAGLTTLVDAFTSLGLPKAAHIVKGTLLVSGIVLLAFSQALQHFPSFAAIDAAKKAATTMTNTLSSIFLGLVSAIAVILCVACPGTTPAQVVSAETLALDLTQSACSVADTTGEAYVIFACSLATAAENAAITVTQVFVKVPAEQVATFALKHPKSPVSDALVAASKAAKAK